MTLGDGLAREGKDGSGRDAPLILGAQILLGFQYQGVIQEQFEGLPPYFRAMNAWALGLILLTAAC